MTTMTETSQPYDVRIGCYGSRRGNTLGTLVRERVRDLTADSGLEINVQGMGIPSFIGDKAGTPIPEKHRAALEDYITDPDSYVARASEALKASPRTPATAEDLQSADAVFAVDEFARDQYTALAGEEKGNKYKTVLEGAGRKHAVYGVDMDDTEVPTDFILRVVVPAKTGGVPEKLIPKDARYFDLSGKEYRAGDQTAVEAEAGDLVMIADSLARNIVRDAYDKKVGSPRDA